MSLLAQLVKSRNSSERILRGLRESLSLVILSFSRLSWELFLLLNEEIFDLSYLVLERIFQPWQTYSICLHIVKYWEVQNKKTDLYIFLEIGKIKTKTCEVFCNLSE